MLTWGAHQAGLQEEQGQELVLILTSEPEQHHNTEVSQEPTPQDTQGSNPVLESVSGVGAREVRRERQSKLALNSICHSWICSAQGEKHHMLAEKVRSHLRTLTLCSEQNNRLGSFITL